MKLRQYLKEQHNMTTSVSLCCQPFYYWGSWSGSRTCSKEDGRISFHYLCSSSQAWLYACGLPWVTAPRRMTDIHWLYIPHTHFCLSAERFSLRISRLTSKRCKYQNKTLLYDYLRSLDFGLRKCGSLLHIPNYTWEVLQISGWKGCCFWGLHWCFLFLVHSW